MDNSINTKERFAFYTTFRQLYDVPEYLYKVKNPVLRKQLTRIRLGVSQLKPHLLRYSKENKNKNCPYCKTVQETEIHFILTCPHYDTLREMYIPRKYYVHPNAFKLVLLLTDKNHCVQLSLYLTKAFKQRNILPSDF